MHTVESLHATVDELGRNQGFHFINTRHAVSTNLEGLFVLRRLHFDDVLLIVEKNRNLQLRMGYVGYDSH